MATNDEVEQALNGLSGVYAVGHEDGTYTVRIALGITGHRGFSAISQSLSGIGGEPRIGTLTGYPAADTAEGYGYLLKCYDEDALLARLKGPFPIA